MTATRTIPSVTWAQALAWRMRRQLLDPVGTEPVEGVVHRLVAIQAQHGAGAELAVRLRRQRSDPGEVAEALTDGRLIRTFAFRGATHLMTPEDAGICLSLRAATRMWELPSWQEYYGLTPSDWPAFRAAVRDALTEGPRTRAELGAAVTALRRFRQLAFAFDNHSGTLLKPLAWQGDLVFGPDRAGDSTFQRPDGNPRWAGIPELDDAGPRAIEAYVRTYGPSTPAKVQYWLGEGLGAGRKRLEAWIAGLQDRLVAVDLEGEAALVLRKDLDELASTQPSAAVRLLPGFDPWVLGPGTADPHVVPAAHRTPVSRGANVVIVGGVTSGTWSVAGDRVDVRPFDTGLRRRRADLDEEVTRLATILGQPLVVSVGEA